MTAGTQQQRSGAGDPPSGIPARAAVRGRRPDPGPPGDLRSAAGDAGAGPAGRGAAPGRLTVVRADPAGPAHPGALPGAVRRPAGQPAPRPGRPDAARARRRLLHHRLVRATRATPAWRRRCGSPTRPCCTTAPARSTWSGPRRRAAAGRRTPTCCSAWSAAAAEPIAGGRHKVFGHPGPERHPADLDHRLAPAPGRRRWPSRWTGRPSGSAGARRLAGRRGRGVQLRRRLGQPLHRGGRLQHRGLLRLPGPAAAAAARLRGQRPGHQRADPAGLDHRRPLGPAASSPTSTPTAPTWPRCTTPPLAAASWVRERRRRRSCTCRWSGSAGTPARTWSRPTAAPPTSPPTPTATRCSARPGCWSRPGVLTPGRGAGAVRGVPATGCWPGRPRSPGRPG